MFRLALIFVSLFAFASCTKTSETVSNYFSYPGTLEAAGVKLIPIRTPKGTFNVWTKRFGNNPKIKILLLHGGPAMTHEYMECFETFFQREGFEFYEYDQLGSYYSEQPNDTTLCQLKSTVSKSL